jgi:hypothetical protein
VIVVGGNGGVAVAALLAEREDAVILGPTQQLPSATTTPTIAPTRWRATCARPVSSRDLDLRRDRGRSTLPYEAGRRSRSGCRGRGAGRDHARPASILGLGDRLGTLEPGRSRT